MKKWLALPAIFLFLLALAITNFPDRVDAGVDVQQAYDLIVVGGDPEGIAAAVSGARNGISVLLVDTRPVLGGLMTQGWLNSLDMSYGPEGNILNGGIFLEFFKEMGGDSFDVQKAAGFFHKLVDNERKLDVLLSVQRVELLPFKDKTGTGVTKLKGIKLLTEDDQTLSINAKAVIDATQDADLAAAIGVPYTIGHADFGRPDDNMAVTLVFRLQGIDDGEWSRLCYYLMYQDPDRNSGANWKSAWGFGTEMGKYKSSVPQIAMRGLNIGRQDDGSLLINALQIFGVDPLNEDAKDKAREVALRELPRIVTYIAQEIPGLKGLELAGAAPELYVRESRHIIGEYRLTIDDVLEHRDFYDRIAFGSYPVDVQATGSGKKGYVVGNPLQYAVPFRSLIPVGVENLLVVGRSASFDSLAAGSARTIPVGMAAGQSAGAAVALSLEKRKTFHELAASEEHMLLLQGRLNNQGMNLAPKKVRPLAVSHHWAYPGMKFVRSLGLALGSYNNDYGLDREITEAAFIRLLSEAVKQTSAGVTVRPYFVEEGNSLTIYDAAYMFCRYMGKDIDKKAAYDYWDEQGFWDWDLVSRVRQNDGVITVGMAYQLVEDFLEQVGCTDPAGEYVVTEGN